MLNALYILNPLEWPRIYGPKEQKNIASLIRLLHPDALTPDEAWQRADLLEQTEILLSGWGGPKLDEKYLEKMPRLKGVFYGAGSARYMWSDAFWQRQIPLTTANAANAVPVAEYALAHILLGLKSYWRQVAEAKKRRAFFHPQLPVAGTYGSKVGIISLSTIGRHLRRLLRNFDIHILAYDPLVDDREAAQLEVELVSLSELFQQSDVITLHAPHLPVTEGLITGDMIAGMKPGATFINTARGLIVREKEMIEVLKKRTDITAILDVTDPEPPLTTCELFDLPNVLVSPHIAGSLDQECQRMGRYILEELQRFLADQPLLGAIQPNRISVTA